MNILFYAPYAGNWYLHTLWEGTIAHALKHRGANVRFVGCDSAFQACDIYWGNTPRSEAGCQGCHQLGRQVFSQLHLESSFLGEALVSSDRTEALQWLETLADDELFESHFGDYPLGEWCRASLIAHYRQPRFEPLGGEQAETFRNYLMGAALAVRSLARQFDAFQPDLVVTLNGSFFSNRVALELARERGIRVVTHERGLLPESLQFTENETIWSRSRLQDLNEAWQDIPLSASEIDAAAQYIHSRRYGKQLAWHAFSPPPQPIDAIRSKLGIQPNCKVVSLFTTSQSEASTAEWKGAFEDMVEWVSETIAWIKERPEYHLVVRIHPNEDHVQGRNSLVIERYQAALSALPDNVSVIWPRDDVSSYTLVDISSSVLVYNTTMGLEAAATHGLPVGVVGRPIYQGWGFTFDLDERKHYSAFLDKLVAESTSSEIRRKALRAVCRLYFGLSIPVPQVSVIKFSHGQLNYASTNDLLPGRSAHLDRIADGLMGRAPLYPPPNAEDRLRTCAMEDAFLAASVNPPARGQDLPKVSVVAYIYNYAHYLDGAIQSILNQTYSNFELFILDDGSTDGTPELVKKYLSDPRVRYEYQQNKGRDRLHETFNRCLEATSGEFIVIANGDDLLHPQKIEKQLAAFHQNPELEIVSHDATFINAEGVERPGSFGAGFGDEFYGKRIFGRHMFRGCMVPNPTVMFRRSILKRIGLQEYGWMHDYQFWLKAAMARCRFHVLPEKLLRYRIHEESHSTSSVRHGRIVDEDMRMRREMRQRYSIEDLYPEIAYCLDPQEAKAFAHLDFGLLVSQCHLPLYDMAIDEFRMALDLAPGLSEAKNNLAVALLLDGQREEAMHLLMELAAANPFPEAVINLQLAQHSSGTEPVAYKWRMPELSVSELAHVQLTAEGEPREEILQATVLAVLERETEDQEILRVLIAYLRAFAAGSSAALVFLADAEEEGLRLSSLFDAACVQANLPPDETPDVSLQVIKPQEFESVFLGQLLGAQTVVTMSGGARSAELSRLAEARGREVIDSLRWSETAAKRLVFDLASGGR